MDHTMAICADQRQGADPRLIIFSERFYRLDVMAFHEALTTSPVHGCEIEPAHLAFEVARLSQCALFLSRDQSSAPLALPMHPCQDAAFWSFEVFIQVVS
jgi:hypothetical protein